MPKLVIKSGYIKSGKAAGYLKYIATRDGVELLPSGYVGYMAERSRSHGLFSAAPNVSLDRAKAEAEEHTGPKWTLILSLCREDAARLGYDCAEIWRQLILRHTGEIAAAMKIPPDQLRWYAAFHDEGHHPHVHMMVWSADPKQGFLTKEGIQTIRSKLTNDIFQGELQQLYQRKDVSYKEVANAAQEAMSRMISQMSTSLCDSPVIAKHMAVLAEALNTVSGKKVYGYLPKSVKEQVDAIVDALAELPEVAECYETWNQLRDELEGYYKAKPRQRLSLSKQKEFRAIKNMVIREAENLRLGVFTFEDEGMEDEPEPPNPRSQAKTFYQMAAQYQDAKAVLSNNDQPLELKEVAVDVLKQLWEAGFTVAAHQLGKVWRDGLCGPSDLEQAELWFQHSAEAGNDYSQYALGKLLQSQGRISESLFWYEKASAQGNQYADYRLGKLYLQGESVPQDVNKAVERLSASAEAGNQYAQYTLGKLYLLGKDVERDRDAARQYLSAAAEQGNEYAQFFLDHFDRYRDPSLLLCVSKLLYHMSRVFQQNSVPPVNPAGIRIDSKRRRALLEKRLAMGHKIDDHEDHPVM